MKTSLSVLASVLVVTACQAISPTVSEDRRVRFFRDLVYGEDFALNRKQDQLQRWTGTIILGISGTHAAEHRAKIEDQMRRVSELTGVTVEISDPPSKLANLEFHFVADQLFPVNREWVPCAMGSDADGGAMTRGAVIISTLAARNLQACLSHEIMHAMGFSNHSPILPSTLSPLHGEQDFTSWDEIALRVLYDDRLRPGMTEDEAMPIARQIIRELRNSEPTTRENPAGS